jgi:hypothetical protein
MHMRNLQYSLGLVGLFATLLAIGCADSEPVIEYEPPIKLDDLAPGLPRSENDYVLLTDEHTVARFAATLAIAKFVPHDGDNGLQMKLAAPPQAEQALWTETLRGLAKIRDVIFISPLTVKPRDHDMESLCETARAMRARLLLVYARNGLGPNSAQVMGVIYDAATCEPLGTMHASACFVNNDGVEVSIVEADGDHRDVDARFQSQQTFERLALQCLRDLMDLDELSPTKQPHDWGTPFEERWWLPDRRR